MLAEVPPFLQRLRPVQCYWLHYQSNGANYIQGIIPWYTCKSSSKSQSIQSLLKSH